MVEIEFARAWKLEKSLFVDMRSPAEYLLDHIPGAVNIPVFNDEERALVGTTYKQINPRDARYLGLQIVLPKLEGILKQLEELGQNHSLVLYCWRGGMRSGSIQMVAQLMSIPCYRLNGGYKAYRNYVNQFFEQPCPFPVVVLHGLTGTGKTETIKCLQQLDGCQPVDLEGLAIHRGSAFGHIGLEPQPSQKMFESKLWAVMEQYQPNKPLIVECESKRIGKVLLPKTLYDGMQAGKHILLFDNVPNRIQRIIEDYQPSTKVDKVIEAVQCLKNSLGGEQVEQLVALAQRGFFEPLVEYLLLNYYDPLYKYPCAESDNYDLSADNSQPQIAAERINHYINNNINNS